MSTIKANTIENVAGTETHSVDTMGIESGTGTNLKYIKFPDGTLITTGYVAGTSFTVSQVSGKVLQTGVAVGLDVTGVAEFIALPVVTGCTYSTGNFVGRIFEGTASLTNHSAMFNQNVGITGSNFTAVSVQWQAVGSWK